MFYTIDLYENGQTVSFNLQDNKLVYKGNTWYFPRIISPMEAALLLKHQHKNFI